MSGRIILTATVAFLAGAMLILPSGSSAADFKRIKTLKDFKAQLVGKSAIAEGGWATYHADGTFTGRLSDGQKVSGKWHWRKGYFCRSGRLGSDPIAYDCQLVFVSRNRVRFIRNRGRGPTVEYRIGRR